MAKRHKAGMQKKQYPEKEVMGYKFISDADLSMKLGKNSNYVNILRKRYPHFSYEDCIEYALNNTQITRIRNRGKVCGYSFTSYEDLSTQLGKGINYVSNWLNRFPDKTVEDCIKYVNGDSFKYNRSTPGEVRGYKYKSYSDLGKQLGMDKSYVSYWMNRHPDKTIEDCIDAILYPYNEACGYKYKNYTDLSLQLGRSRAYVSTWLKNNPDKTIEDCIKFATEKDTNISDSGISYRNYSDLSKRLGKSYGYVSGWLSKNPGKTVTDCIDYVMNDKNSKNHSWTRKSLSNTMYGFKYTYDSYAELSKKLGKSDTYVASYLHDHPDATAEDVIVQATLGSKGLDMLEKSRKMDLYTNDDINTKLEAVNEYLSSATSVQNKGTYVFINGDKPSIFAYLDNVWTGVFVKEEDTWIMSNRSENKWSIEEAILDILNN